MTKQYLDQKYQYIIFLSENERLEEYLRCWKKYKPHTNMKISEDDITPNLIPYCDDNGCFGVCVRTIMKYNLLP